MNENLLLETRLKLFWKMNVGIYDHVISYIDE